ncbi:guanitoxin biosynthesis heme-dependent pre-guanitoxin N-hydroxylase GntA [Arenimonas composti]|uniref:YqcI/YcgG family protein n=1 Tax=Arenimonas composti TR7-09 = DSM 18010 TaxID=1121013 RepID=A0A091BIK6_9GAMM|nr:guanitoxin biosynthesis heme-dependent pre-guanitoxin N-hydroxylase GntA [Arenimonas composti]KFN50619.1 hypothetical protein P873_05520 [Arenimonas composti TR7-09 = DSM 18010]
MSSMPVADRVPHSPARGVEAQRLRTFIERATFPCVAAKAVLRQGGLRMIELGPLADPRNATPLLDALMRLAPVLDEVAVGETALHSLAAVFTPDGAMDEHMFEARLWEQLQQLHDLDVARGHAWAEGVGADPDAGDFSFSLAEHPFFVIGLHPGSSRMARRAPVPVLVFNSQRQFARLRADGRYAKMQAATRARDLALQGSLNPNLADWGSAAETRQYSGRAVEADWRCPFRRTGS